MTKQNQPRSNTVIDRDCQPCVWTTLWEDWAIGVWLGYLNVRRRVKYTRTIQGVFNGLYHYPISYTSLRSEKPGESWWVRIPGFPKHSLQCKGGSWGSSACHGGTQWPASSDLWDSPAAGRIPPTSRRDEVSDSKQVSRTEPWLHLTITSNMTQRLLLRHWGKNIPAALFPRT